HRYTTTEFRRTGPFYYYVPWIVAGVFPWSVLLPESAVAAWRARRRWASADRLFVVWAIVVVVFFSLSKSKRPDYILSAIVALGALTARILDLALAGNEPSARLLRRATAGLSVICLAGGGGLLVARLQPHILAN